MALGGEGAASPHMLENHERTEGWSTNIAAVFFKKLCKILCKK